ncbi:hypothetical protein [Escherichia marmotae]|uniref:hypothetical protein n=1 Tax=Escherichia marmotae TaxID=1499973 RepID=UPI003D98DAD2
MCKMPALVLWESALSLVLATFPFIFLLIPSCQPAGGYPFLTYSSFHSYHQSLVFVSYRAGVDAYFPVCLHRLNKIQQSLKESYSVQITEALLSEPGDIRRFIQQAVDHWPRLLVIHFTVRLSDGVDEYLIPAFYREFHQRLNALVIHRSQTGGLSSPVVLRGLWETHSSVTRRGLLLLSQDLMYPPGTRIRADDADSHLVALLQQTWAALSPEGHCTVEGGYRLARAATSGESEPFTALKSTLRSLTRPVVAGLFR